MAAVVLELPGVTRLTCGGPEQTVVDLRRMDRPCKQSVNVHERRLRKLWHDIRMVRPLTPTTLRTSNCIGWSASEPASLQLSYSGHLLALEFLWAEPWLQPRWSLVEQIISTKT